MPLPLPCHSFAGVAFAPHRAMDVAAWGVDFYAFSTYKARSRECCRAAGRTRIGISNWWSSGKIRSTRVQQQQPTRQPIPTALRQVFGPHMGALFGTHEAWARAGEGPNFFFVPGDQARRRCAVIAPAASACML